MERILRTDGPIPVSSAHSVPACLIHARNRDGTEKLALLGARERELRPGEKGKESESCGGCRCVR